MKAITANPSNIQDLFRKYEFEIPEYQRPYSWGKDQCEDLWKDLSDFLTRATDTTDNKENDKEEYFLGSIVVYPDPKNKKRLCVIDGQQRLITLLIFMRALLSKTAHKTLEESIYIRDSQTGEVSKGNPRIVSMVEDGKNQEFLMQILQNNPSQLEREDKKNTLLNNYNLLQEWLGEWWEAKDKTADRHTEIVKIFLENIMLLPIECYSEDDALNLFEILNNRGKPLRDADIFKAKIYKAIDAKDRDVFMKKWDSIKDHEDKNDHEDKFRIYMHISRADKGDLTKEIKLRDYMTTHHLGNQEKPLATNWEEVMFTLEKCQWISKSPSFSEDKNKTVDEEIAAEEGIYWNILLRYPNKYWSYPLYVFLHKYMKPNEDDDFYLPDNKREEYVNLLKDTTRYFYMKGVVHKSVNIVKGTTYEVCKLIAEGKDYKKPYQANIPKDEDKKLFERRLRDSELGGRRGYLDGIIYLNAALNPSQKRIEYGKFSRSKTEIEHILPKKYFDRRWSEDEHKKWLNAIGNLMPLEKSVNIRASNNFFQRKQEKYKQSKVQDALDLAEKIPGDWNIEDVKKRHEESLERLKKFFDEL